MGDSRPDFLLETNDTQVPAVAIFVDGRSFHASPQHNRLASDAHQREVLRGSGRVVLAVSAADLGATDGPASPSWFSEAIVGSVISRQPLMTTPAAYQRLRLGPVDWLLEWITAPTPDETRVTARAVPVFLLSAASRISVGQDLPLDQVASDVLTGAATAGGERQVAVWREGPVAAAIEMVGNSVRIAVVLDDRAESLSGAHGDGWRAWLRLSNALALRDWQTVITTVSRVGSEAVVAPVAATDVDLPPAWLQLHQAARIGAEQDLVAELAALPNVAVPVLGFEGPEGIPIDIAWPGHRLAIAVEGMDDADLEDLRAAGWTVLDPGVDAVMEQVRTAMSGSDRVGATGESG